MQWLEGGGLRTCGSVVGEAACVCSVARGGGEPHAWSSGVGVGGCPCPVVVGDKAWGPVAHISVAPIGVVHVAFNHFAVRQP